MTRWGKLQDIFKIEAVVGKRRTRVEAEDRFLAAKLEKQKDDTKPKQKGDGKQGNGIKMVRRAHFGYC